LTESLSSCPDCEGFCMRRLVAAAQRTSFCSGGSRTVLRVVRLGIPLTLGSTDLCCRECCKQLPLIVAPHYSGGLKSE
jgi:hypothetical protein